MATQWKVPTALVAKEPEAALPPVIGLVEVKARGKVGGPMQVGSLGPKSSNVIAPVGVKPPVTVAVSVIAAPTMTVLAEGVVAIAGVARAMVTGSTVQPEVTGVLLVSPL